MKAPRYLVASSLVAALGVGPVGVPAQSYPGKPVHAACGADG